MKEILLDILFHISLVVVYIFAVISYPFVWMLDKVMYDWLGLS